MEEPPEGTESTHQVQICSRWLGSDLDSLPQAMKLKETSTGEDWFKPVESADTRELRSVV